MKSRYTYSIFFVLGVSVFVMIFLAYRYVVSPKITISDADNADMDDTTYKLPQAYTSDTWLGQFKKDLNQKSYFYALPEMQLELN